MSLASATDDQSLSFSISDCSRQDELVREGDKNKEDSNSLLAKRETRAVWVFRLLFCSVLIASFALVAVLIFLYTSNSEKVQFEQQFGEDANKVLQSLGTSLDLTLGGIDVFVVSIVSYARATNQIWPFVTIPDFAVRAEKVRTLTKAVYLNLYNYVSHEQRYKWEAYSALYGPVWVEETLAMQQREGMFTDFFDESNITDVTYWNVIHDYEEFVKEKPGVTGLDRSGPFLPMWETSPLLPIDPPYNWDLLSNSANVSAATVFKTHKVCMTEAYLIAYPNDTETIEENELEAEWISRYVTTGENPMEPISDIYYPIVANTADRINIHDENYNASEHQLGGFLSISIYWRDLLKGILPEGSDGITIVFENDCNPPFTYQIYGPSVKFLGTGDFHQSKYDSLEKSSLLLDLDQYYIDAGHFNTGIPVNKDYCPFFVRVFPSDVMEQAYRTNKPVIFTLTSISIFLFTAAAFLLYDWWVERRQKLVMDTAVKSTAIVSDLFPSNVRDRLYPQNDKEQDKQRAQNYHYNTKQKRRLSEFLSNNSEAEQPPSQQIADFFPEVTILFGDISGFTFWSDTREPSQVFTLLETLYGAFDRIAKRRGVLKIETIGDCYVAVAGIPEPLKRSHAVVMAVFAAECRKAMNALTSSLEPALGPGTEKLMLRIGIHSGPVTAGVLRGEKSRFQLFGDSVNTTARIESSGIPNRIHVSQQTARLLQSSDKAEWVTAREGLVQAKGKGEMQTYWVEPTSRRGTVASSSVSGTDY